MKQVNIQTHYMANRDFIFLKGFIIPFKSVFMQFSIQCTYGSFKEELTNWETLDFSLSKTIHKNEKSYHLQLHNWSNCSYFKICVAGPPINDFEILPEQVIPKKDKEIIDELQQKRIVFLGLARDTQNTLPTVLNQISKIGNLFKEYKIYIFENDSIDNTLEILKELKNSKPIEYFSLSGLDSTFPDRTIRLSYARNYLLNATKHLGFDYVVCFDTDGVFLEIPEDSFLSCFTLDEVWDGCFPVMNPYYDIWAFRHRNMLSDDYKELGKYLPKVIGEENMVRYVSIPTRLQNFEMYEGWLWVDSAFGGMALYKANAYYQSSYWGEINKQELCEHVSLHSKMRSKNARLYINPEFKIT